MTSLLSRRGTCALALALAATSALGCHDLDGFDQPWQTLPPVALDKSVAYVERGSATAYVIDPADPALGARTVAVGKNAALAVQRHRQDQLLVLAQGQRGEAHVPAEDASLTVVPGDSADKPLSIKLGARFNALAQSEDGRFVVCHFVPSVDGHGRPIATSADDVLFNPNLIAVVDLASGAPTAAPRTLRSFGSVPLGVTFSPPLTLPGGRVLRLGVALSQGYVTLFDLEASDRAEVTVQLTLQDDRRVLRPAAVLFDQRDATKEPTIFVRADGSNDIYALRLSPVAIGPEQSNDWRPVLSLLSAAAAPADMEVFAGPDGGTRLLVVTPGNGEALIVDPATSRTTSLKLGIAASRILLFNEASPAQPTKRPRALLVPLGSSPQLGFLDLDQVEDLRTRNLDTRSMGAPASHLVPWFERGLVVVQHASATGLSVVDLSQRTIAPLVTSALESVAVRASTSDKLWIVTASRDRLGYLMVPQFQVGDVRLDATARAVLPLGAGRDGKRRVVVDHDHSGGRITVIDADNPSRATARSATGFLYTNLLERRVP